LGLESGHGFISIKSETKELALVDILGGKEEAKEIELRKENQLFYLKQYFGFYSNYCLTSPKIT
jgi:hypothetical protein